ncbi:cellobiose phosphorylase [Altererythrobacter sp. KTW20L]|nr:cellobiose phosphorylase [Altererythrobacter sp. KTW20L]
MAAAAKSEPASSSAAEWLLDNGYQVQRAMMLLREDMPSGFYLRLRPLSVGPAAGEPRILLLAHDLLAASHFQLSRENVLAYLEGYQSHHALDIAELWALPAMLRIACIERLVAGVAEAFRTVRAPFAISRSCALNMQSGGGADCVARAIANLAVVSSLRWKEIFDATSHVDKILARDPADTYPQMDFDTRDACRQSVERLAELGSKDELAVAEQAISLSAQHTAQPRNHVGHWLIGSGIVDLERSMGIVQPWTRRAGRRLLQRPGSTYAAALFLCGIVGLLLPAAYLSYQRADLTGWIFGLALSALPVTVLAITIVNWLVTLTVGPRQLPKLDFSEAIDPEWPTIVAVPVIIGNVAEARDVLSRLEAHRLANPGARGYVLLSDPADAQDELAPADQEIERTLRRGIQRLNRKLGGGFCLLHRTRRHNPTQGCWMAWERKRGKIDEFNTFLLTGNRDSFPVFVGEVDKLVGARFVVTADADTRLPPGSVARLASTLAHPLNRPVFNESGRVVSGYTVLQPRVEIAPHGRDTLFARLFGGDTAIDIYSRAVSDVFQDLTGTGNYVGKGIYDVAAFARSLEGRIPENQLLSHDLWEGLHGRAGLASDIIVYESYPDNYAAYVRRWHRWIRGDWQLLPWLLGRVPGPGGTRLPNRLTLFDRLRIWDNMRRSLVPASVVLLLLGGWFILPGSPLFWTALALLVPSAWLFTDLVTGLARGRRRGVIAGTMRQAGEHLQRWLLQVVFLLSDMAIAIHAIGITLFRLRRGTMLLEWTSAAHVSGLLARNSVLGSQWGATWTSPILALTMVPFLVLDHHALAAAAALLAMWFAAPGFAAWTAQPRNPKLEPLSADDRQYLRVLARRSWLYFECFAGPEDHWLPPDNHQEAPIRATAHRTSPTNIGMLALSALSAWRLGHLGTPEFVVRMQAMLDTLDKLERWNGHILNWYDTRTLAPLEPRYVSTVDSGNLAVSLIVLANGCRDIIATAHFRSERWEGLKDCLHLLGEALEQSDLGADLRERIKQLQGRVATNPDDRSAWQVMIRDATDQLTLLRGELADALEMREAVDLASLEDLRDWLERSEHHLQECSNELQERTAAGQPGSIKELIRIAGRARRMAEGMDFRGLYDSHRKLFHIGYDVSSQRIDQHYYDLLASEARLASYFAIAKRDVAPDHWFQLGRPIVKRKRQLALVSWNGSMFEYLMPSLFLRSDPSTLLGETETAAVALQKSYADRQGVPWGISESGFASHGTDGIWRYRAFGVPELGLRRGLADDLVITPYATALALAAAPREAVANMRRLAARGAMGRLGFHEALDFTPERATDDGNPALVRSYMAHHHGMSIAAIANVLCEDVLVRWFHADERMESVDLLLNERIPWELPPELKRVDHIRTDSAEAPALPRPQSWEASPGLRPMTFLLGNGRMSLRIGSDGCGDLLWNGNALTCPTGINRDKGQFIYLRDRASGCTWSPTSAPIDGADDRHLVVHPHKLEFRCRAGTVSTSLEVFISAAQDVEVRRIRLVNDSPDHTLVEFASHADCALAEAGEWSRHPAFARLFVASRSYPEIDVLAFTRRGRNPDTPGLAMAQRFVGTTGLARLKDVEVSRVRSRGRLGTRTRFPHFDQTCKQPEQYPLDPVSAFGGELALPPHGEAEFAIVTVVAPRESEALELAGRYTSLAALDWAEQDAAEAARNNLRAIDLPAARLREAELLLSALIRPSGPATPLSAPPGDKVVREDLWALGISGDLPILLVELDEQFDSAELRFVLAAHRSWRWRGSQIDLVLLHPGLPGYVEPLRERVLDLLRDSNADEHLGERGGIMLVGREQNDARAIRALRCAATAMIVDGRGSIEEQLREAETERMPVPLFVATAPLSTSPEASQADSPAEHLTLHNGLGGFTPDGRYCIDIPAKACTPAPWANVLANHTFGSIVTEAGLGFSFAENSGENRLTPWHNDAVSDPPAEALYLRDEETGEVWSVTSLPAGDDTARRVVHGFGETEWSCQSKGLEQQMQCFVANGDPIKVVTLRLRNRSQSTRRLTATFYADWLLGTTPGEPAPFRSSFYRPDLAAILGRNPWQREYRHKLAFLASTGAVHSFTSSRADFLGHAPDWLRPPGLDAWGLGERMENHGADATAALQVHLDIAPEETSEIAFLIGEVESEEGLPTILRHWRAPGTTETERHKLAMEWKRRCGAIEVKTPDPAFDVMVNRWLVYQTMSSRLFARAGYYQASGAYGFRDQLQDVLALLLSSPDLAREHILRAAAHQFEEGDVLHWWHPPSSKGVRTRCSDDLAWLPFAVARYVAATGDTGVLDERVPFLHAPELAASEHDRFSEFPRGTDASLFEHCLRAFDRSFRLGQRGLPLIGDGDWNDGMNRVGSGGLGESVWLAWFLAVTIRDFADMCEATGQHDFALRWLPRREQLLASVERHGWDGEWYVRAFDDQGRPWGSSSNDECRIDALVQSWAVIAGADKARSAQAIDNAFKHLVLPDDKIARLLDPPFDETARDPGYIKAYPPGIRENGGQYSHGSAWLGIACAMQGDGARAKAVFDRLNPVRHAATQKDVETYRTEPYALAADIAAGDHLGRGGWSWYTGAAGWTWRLATEHILGIRLEGDRVAIAPCLPPDWPGFSATLRRDGAIEIEVNRGNAAQCLVDGKPSIASSITFPGAGKVTRVELTIAGQPRGGAVTTPEIEIEASDV